MNTKENSQREPTFLHRRRTPSFSSSLLDSICRSIDESNGNEDDFCNSKPSLMKQRKQFFNHDETDYLKGNCVSVNGNSTTTSSDSSSRVEGRVGGVFSSSDTDSVRPKQSSDQEHKQRKNQRKTKVDAFSTDGFTKTKLKALKIYGGLKKVKQPISPGGRITAFLYSFFNSNAKKVTICSVGATEDVSFQPKLKTGCSSTATSFPRSSSSSMMRACNKYDSNGMKESVRLYPVSAIVDQSEAVKSSSLETERNRAGGDYLRNYEKKNTQLRNLYGIYVIDDDNEEEDDENDDCLSCASSDLFELDHIVGVGRYREELPVYETTDLKTNQDIANGLIL